MEAIQVYAILNKKLNGLTSGVKSATVNGTTITFVFNDGSTSVMTFPTIKDDIDSIKGLSITDVDVNSDNTITCTLSDGSIITSKNKISVKDGLDGKDGNKGENGKDGFSPIITEDENNTNDVYKLYITDSNGTFVTPNLKGRDGEGSNVMIDVDDEMSDTSENVVQNKVIKSYIDDKFANTNKVQSDWNESDTSSEAFILNKPIIPSEYDDTLVTSRLETIEVDNSTLREQITKIETQIGNYTVNSNVPSDAKFTDTNYDVATTSINGLMSSEDKSKLDGIEYKLLVTSFLSENQGLFNNTEWEALCSAKTVRDSLESVGITSADQIVGSFLMDIRSSTGTLVEATDVDFGTLSYFVNFFSNTTSSYTLCKVKSGAGGGYYNAKFTIGVIVKM